MVTMSLNEDELAASPGTILYVCPQKLCLVFFYSSACLDPTWAL